MLKKKKKWDYPGRRKILSEGKSDSLRTKINLENNHDMTVIRIFARDIMK